MSGPIARVVVPLDAASETGNALAVAARLAAYAGVPLHGVFVEDEDLLRLARLPFVRHVMAEADLEPPSVEAIAQQLRAAAERARRELAAAARRNRVEWSFEVVRLAAEAPLVAASEGDLVVAGALSRPIGRHFRVEWRWWSFVERVSGPLLLAGHEGSAGGLVATIVHDRSAGSQRLLDMAARLAAAAGGALVVLRPPQLAEEPGFSAWVAEQAAPYSVRCRIAPLPEDPVELERRLGALGSRLLAVHAAAEGRPERLRALFGRLACDILVVH